MRPLPMLGPHGSRLYPKQLTLAFYAAICVAHTDCVVFLFFFSLEISCLNRFLQGTILNQDLVKPHSLPSVEPWGPTGALLHIE